MFDGFLKLAPRCNVCGLDYSFADPADGPAFFVMMIMAWPITAFGVWIELAYEPPFWVHLLTTLPVLLIAGILPLRFFKGWLVASQYVHKAEEARFELSHPASTRTDPGRGPQASPSEPPAELSPRPPRANQKGA